jgi:beta-galactosidase
MFVAQRKQFLASGVATPALRNGPPLLALRRALSFFRLGVMKTLLAWSAFLFMAVFSLSLLAAQDSPRERLLFDFGWKFHLSDDWPDAENLAKAGSSKGPAGRKFDDSQWQTVNLPHDWVVQLPFDEKANYSHGYKPVGPHYPQNSVGWYRRTFDLPPEDAGKRIWVEFDGVFRDAQVFVNGWLIGHHEGGYNSFRYDITDVANCGGTNEIAVRVDASKFEGWFYEGAGIYRHVWLVKTAPLAVAPDGVFVWSQFKDNVPKGKPDIHMQVQLLNSDTNDADATVTAQIISPEGQELASVHKLVTVPAGLTTEVDQMTRVSKPELWSPESPALYKLVTTMTRDGQIVDRKETPFGIRTVGFDPDKGFLLNGEHYEIQGTCNHQDHAGVGSALPDRLQYFRISRLKDMGCNAYRTSHNEPTAELLEACDQLGMLVMDENRLLGSDPENLAKFRQQILRDRNHPSVVIWSICNEESRQAYPDGGRVGATMQAFVKRLDPTRPVTCAESVGNDYSGLMSAIEIRGWNYHAGSDIDDYHREHPQQPEVGTEQGSTVSTRGVYVTDKTRGYVSAYDVNFPRWASTSELWWSYFADRPWLSGGFYWTGFDYRGEPTPYKWPCINSHFGILDTCGFPKDNFYYYQSVWTDKPVLHLLPHWNWAGKEGQNIDVWCYANCQAVELFLNGQSLGRKTMPRYGHLEWQAPYSPGTLSAKGYDSSGEVVSATQVETTGAPTAVELQPDRNTISADSEDISIITVSVHDEPGRIVPTASNLVHFSIQGPGRIIGVGNGDPSCHEPDQYPTQSGWQRSVFNGLAQIIVQSTRIPGEITLTATADGLQPQKIYIESQACDPRPSVP